MKNTKVYVDFITEKLKKLLSIDSPTGYTKDAIAWLKAEYEAMGYAPVITTKGGLLVQLAKGCEGNGGVLVETHTDTLGGMVAEVKGNGRLRLTALGEQCGDGKLRCHHKRRKTVRGLLPDEQPVDPCQRFLRPAGPHLRQYGGRSG